MAAIGSQEQAPGRPGGGVRGQRESRRQEGGSKEMGCQEYTLHRGSVSGQCSGGDHHIQAGFQGDRIKLKYINCNISSLLNDGLISLGINIAV